MVRRGRKVIRDLDRDVLEHRTKNRGFFVGPSSTYQLFIESYVCARYT